MMKTKFAASILLLAGLAGVGKSAFYSRRRYKVHHLRRFVDSIIFVPLNVLFAQLELQADAVISVECAALWPGAGNWQQIISCTLCC